MRCLCGQPEDMWDEEDDEEWDISDLCWHCASYALDQAALEAWENVLDSADWARYDAEIVSQKGQT